MTAIQNKKELQTSDIHRQVEEVRRCAEELEACIVQIRARQMRSKIEQYGREIFTDPGQEEMLKNQMDHLNSVTKHLDRRIALAHVGLTGSLAEGLRASQRTIQKVDERVQGIEHAGRRIATVLDKKQRKADRMTPSVSTISID